MDTSLSGASYPNEFYIEYMASKISPNRSQLLTVFAGTSGSFCVDLSSYERDQKRVVKSCLSADLPVWLWRPVCIKMPQVAF